MYACICSCFVQCYRANCVIMVLVLLSYTDAYIIYYNSLYVTEHYVYIRHHKPLCKKVNGKAAPLQACSGPECSRNFRFPDYMTTAQDGGKAVSLTYRPPLPPGNAAGTHICYRLSRPEGRSAIGRIMSMKNSNDTIWDRTSDLPICSTVP